ncbi:MAG: tetratricopeptide repeat protein [Nitrospirota bacterium]
MKKRKIKDKGIRGLIVIGVFLVFLTGCSTTQNIFSSLQFSDYSNIKTGISNKDIADFGVSIRPARGNPDSHYLLSKYYQERGRHQEAIEELEKTISIDPAYVKAYNRIGVSYDKLGDFSRAVAYYKNALTLNPELDYALNNLGYSYILQGKYDEAVMFLEKAVDLNNRNKQYHNNLGLAYTKHHKFEQAVDEFRLAGNREAARYNFKRMLYEKYLAPEVEKGSSNDLTVDTSFETLISRIDSTKIIPETDNYRKSRKVISRIKKNKRLVFGKPMYGPGLIQKNEKLVFGKPIYGPGLIQKNEKLVFGKPIYGPDLIQKKEKLLFGKPIYGPGLKSTEKGLTSRKKTLFSFVRKLFNVFDEGSNKT